MKFLIIPLFIVISITLGDGTWLDTTLVPPSLGFETPVRIYLPEGYDPGGSIDYPVIYWLHGWGYTHISYSINTKVALDSLISSQQIQSVILVKPNGHCEPYDGCMWVNSLLYGDYEDYVVYDLVSFIDSSFCTISDQEYRCIAGHSMGATGSMRIALEHTDSYKAVASHSGYPDMQISIPLFLPVVLDECPETEPPYSYDWGNGPYTDCVFLISGGYSPNLNAPDSVDFLLDENGAVIDSVYSLWELFNPAHIVKEISPPVDLDIFFDCGANDESVGCYESNCSYSDTLTALGIEHEFQNLTGVGHAMNISRFIEEFLFLGEAMTGIEESASVPSSALLESAFPNPFTSSTAIRFELPEATHVLLQVYDVSGRMVRSLINEELGVGLHSFVLENRELVPGMYIFVLKAGTVVETRNCILLR